MSNINAGEIGDEVKGALMVIAQDLGDLKAAMQLYEDVLARNCSCGPQVWGAVAEGMTYRHFLSSLSRITTELHETIGADDDAVTAVKNS
jgi:hypothetical protein